MPKSIYDVAVDLVLQSMYRTRGEDGLETSFLFGQPGAPAWNRRIGTNLFFRRRELIRAALYVRKHGPAYLKAMSIEDVRNLLTDFVIDNYGSLASETLFHKFECSYAEYVSARVKASIVEQFAVSSIFKTQDAVTLYPLVPIVVEADFDSEPFFLIKPASLGGGRVGRGAESRIVPDEYPPIIDSKVKKERPSSWLGVRSPIIQASNKMKAAILGAVALTPHPNYRHQFSLRHNFGGYCTLKDGSYRYGGEGPHAPAMSTDIIIKVPDHAWLAILAPKLLDSKKEARKQVRALEYFYRAWPLDASERFPWLFMALDALFGDASQATQAVIDAIGRHGDIAFDYRRLRLILSLRASVIHGGAPDVYDSDSYHRYYENYGDDPIRDLGLIAARSLRSVIFEGALVEHPDPYADLIRDYKEGKLDRDALKRRLERK
jgi:hypothetical protein